MTNYKIMEPHVCPICLKTRVFFSKDESKCLPCWTASPHQKELSSKRIINDIERLIHYFFKDRPFCIPRDKQHILQKIYEQNKKRRMKFTMEKYNTIKKEKEIIILQKYKKREGTCCDIYEAHHILLKGDPEHLSTDFIKKISGCNCNVR